MTKREESINTILNYIRPLDVSSEVAVAIEHLQFEKHVVARTKSMYTEFLARKSDDPEAADSIRNRATTRLLHLLADQVDYDTKTAINHVLHMHGESCDQ